MDETGGSLHGTVKFQNDDVLHTPDVAHALFAFDRLVVDGSTRTEQLGAVPGAGSLPAANAVRK